MVSDKSAEDNSTLMLVLPVLMVEFEGQLHVERQAANGVRRWLDNFDFLNLMLPLMPVEEVPNGFIPYSDEMFAGRCRFHPLPIAYTPASFLRTLRPTIKAIDALIDRSTHLSFAIGGLFGDWGAVAILRASAKGRKATVWTDRVESQVVKIGASRYQGLRRAYWTAQALLMKHYERFVVRRAHMGLFHGADCYDAYARYSPRPHLVHDIHLTDAARIDAGQLASKIEALETRAPLKIVYAGRAHPDKGVIDWVRTLAILNNDGVSFNAAWFGTGPELERARYLVSDLGLGQHVSFPGNTNDHAELMATLRSSDLFLFCHKTPESPRCLIEALISGTPIIGYDSAYPRDLISRHSGGRLSPHDPAELAGVLAELDRDRGLLGRMMSAAALDGYPHTDRNVFRHRSDIIKGLEIAGH